ncbi:MAG: thermostable hemolysin [Gammaproteobacteria bacterium]
MTTIPPMSMPAGRDEQRESLLRRVLTPTPIFELAGPDASERAQAEALVTEKFEAAWQARVTQFLPWLLSMHCLGHCSGVAGLRPAAGTRLYLEQYLDEPVEDALAAAGIQAARREIVEIGNLAVTQRGASHLLFLVMTAALHKAGYKWIVFTATRALRNNLDKLGYPMLHLADASPQHLDAETLAAWGRYYDSSPQVVVGSLDEAARLMQERPLLRRARRLYRHQIRQLADALGGA